MIAYGIAGTCPLIYWLINFLTAWTSEFYFWKLQINNVAHNYSSASLYFGYRYSIDIIQRAFSLRSKVDIWWKTSLAWLEMNFFFQAKMAHNSWVPLYVLIYFFYLIIQPDKQEMKLSVFKELKFVFFLLTVVVLCSFARNLLPTIEQTISLLYAVCCSKLNIDQMW